MASKYPYIADKSLYAAVMYACKIIRETGHFNRAVNTAAKRYRIDAGRLETALRQRQAAGQTGKKRGKQKWFVLVNQHANYGDYWHEPFFTGLRVERGASKQTKEKILHEPDFEQDDTISVRVVKEFETKKEAESWLDDWRREHVGD